MIEVLPSFASEWHRLLNCWDGEDQPPIYIALGRLSRHLVEMLANKDTDGLHRAFKIIDAGT